MKAYGMSISEILTVSGETSYSREIHFPHFPWVILQDTVPAVVLFCMSQLFSFCLFVTPLIAGVPLYLSPIFLILACIALHQGLWIVVRVGVYNSVYNTCFFFTPSALLQTCGVVVSTTLVLHLLRENWSSHYLTLDILFLVL
jgi:hypothetical protein